MSVNADPADGYILREATIADAPVLARQRRLMFDSISPMSPEQGTLLEAAILRYIAQAMPAGTFRSWVIEHDGTIVSGGGLQLRTLMPRPGYVYGEPEGMIPGMGCTVRLVTAKKEAALTVPATAVFTDDGDDEARYVYRPAKGDGKPEKQTVKVGLTVGDKVEILDGLAAGDEILASKP